MRNKLILDALTVETFEPGAQPASQSGSPNTFATTGYYFCAAPCESGPKCSELC